MAMSFDQVVQKILGASGLSQDEVMSRIRKKREELGGLITPEGAATIIAKELKIDIGHREPVVRSLKIEDLAPGMSKVDIVGRVARVSEPKEFSRKTGGAGLRGSLLVQDRTGYIRLTLWDEKAKLLHEGKIKKGDAIRVHNAYVKWAIDKQPELGLGNMGEITINPDDPRMKDLPAPAVFSVKIADLKPEMREADVVGRVHSFSQARTFERPDGKSGKVATLTISDPTGSVRISLWDEWADFVDSLRQGDAVKLENASVKVGFKGQTELSLGYRGRIVQNPPEAEKLPQVSRRQLKVSEVEAASPSIELAARVKQIFPLVEFKRSEGKQGKVSSLILADETGTIRASFWDSAADAAQKLKPNDLVLLKNAYSKPGLNGFPEVHIGRNTSVEINPAGVTVSEIQSTNLKISKITPNISSLSVVGRVMEISPVKDFKRADGSSGKVASVKIADETGAMRVSLWNEQASRAEEIKVGDVVKFVDAYSLLSVFGTPEVHLSKRGRIELNPSGVSLPKTEELKDTSPKAPRLRIVEIQRDGSRVETRGTIAHVFHRRPIFDVCPNCGTSIGNGDTSLVCEECGKIVTPEHKSILSFLLDDGTDNIRVTLFGKVAEQILGEDAEQSFQSLKMNPDLAKFYEKIGLVGKEILVAGTVRHDKFTDQLEIRGYEVKTPDPKEEARVLLQSIGSGNLA